MIVYSYIDVAFPISIGVTSRIASLFSLRSHHLHLSPGHFNPDILLHVLHRDVHGNDAHGDVHGDDVHDDVHGDDVYGGTDEHRGCCGSGWAESGGSAKR